MPVSICYYRLPSGVAVTLPHSCLSDLKLPSLAVALVLPLLFPHAVPILEVSIISRMIESLTHDVSVFNVAVFLFASYWIYGLFVRLNDSRRIRALGGHAPAISSWAPWGLDLVYRTLRAVWNNQAYEMWHGIFYGYGNPSNPYTVESRLGGQRMIFTADPENIKAILAAQFHDYGKGERFNIEWHDFLGDSIFTTDGDAWYQGRQMLRPLFLKDRISDLEVHEKHVQILLSHLGGDGQTVDIMDLLFRYEGQPTRLSSWF